MSITYLSQNVVFGVDNGEMDVSGIRPFEKSARPVHSGKSQKSNSALPQTLSSRIRIVMKIASTHLSLLWVSLRK
jgi:hypothetical protein